MNIYREQLYASLRKAFARKSAEGSAETSNIPPRDLTDGERPSPRRGSIPLEQSKLEGRSWITSFLAAWFRESGPERALFFLFRRNLGTTNLAHVELAALVRSHARALNSDTAGFNLLTLDRFVALIAEGMQFCERITGHEDVHVMIEAFVERYGSILIRSIVLDPLNCSCGVYLPPGVTLDLREVTARSAYIHSSGFSVFGRNVKRITPEYMSERLNEYIDRRGEKRNLLAVYCYEDFSEPDQVRRDLAIGGIEEVKVHFEKCFVGGISLIEFFNRYSEERNDVIIPPPGYYKETRRQFGNKGSISSTLWLICEKGIDLSRTEPQLNDERYYICYDQRYYNSDPFFAFDENKPGWIDHTTMPHTLTGALLNLGRANAPESEKLRIHDPFAGSGTTLLECVRLLPAVSKVVGTELLSAGAFAYRDNIDFFSKGPKGEMWVAFEALKGRLESDIDTFGEPVLSLVPLVRKDEDFASTLSAANSATERAKIYLARRVARRAASALGRIAENTKVEERVMLNWIAKEVNYIVRQMSEVQGMYSARREEGEVDIIRESYSPGVALPLSRLEHESMERVAQYVTSDAIQFLEDKKDAYDLIVTDPPYGVNHEFDLVRLFVGLIPLLVKAVAKRGQIFLVLPDKVHTGRDIDPLVRPDFVRLQILAEAAQQGRRIHTQVSWLPEHPVYRGFYWRSAKVLMRKILYFQFED